jgi:hypothetical protein
MGEFGTFSFWPGRKLSFLRRFIVRNVAVVVPTRFAITASVSPERTSYVTGSLLVTVEAVAGATAELGVARPGIVSFWPGRRALSDFRWLTAASSATETLFFLAIFQRLSPCSTV